MFVLILDDDEAIDEPVTSAKVRTVTEVPQVTQSVRVTSYTPKTETIQTHKGVSAESWDVEMLRSYVVSQIEKAHGPFPRDNKKEKAVFSSFLNRWGTQAGPIAQYAFTACGGFWKGSPISVNRFCKGSDQYFAAIIVEKLK